MNNKTNVIYNILGYGVCAILIISCFCFMGYITKTNEENRMAFNEWYKPYSTIRADYIRGIKEIKYSIDEFYIISTVMTDQEQIKILYDELLFKHNKLRGLAHQYNKGTDIGRNYIPPLKVPTITEIQINTIKDILFDIR